MQHKNSIGSVKFFSSLYIILAGICWGIIGIFSKKLSLQGFNSIEITFLRSIITAIILLIYVIIFDISKLKIKLKDLWLFIGTGILSIVFFNVMYFITIKLTTLSMAAILLYTAPCFVMIMSSIFFGEHITKQKITALVLSLIGCLFTTGILGSIFKPDGFSNISTLGILTGIGSGIGYALYTIFGNVALKKYDSITVTSYTFFVASLFLIPFCVKADFFVRLQSSSSIINSLSIGIISTLLPFLLYTLGLKNTEPGKASVMAFVEPMVATIVGIIVFQESITLTGIIGILLIFSSICILNVNKS